MARGSFKSQEFIENSDDDVDTDTAASRGSGDHQAVVHAGSSADDESDAMDSSYHASDSSLPSDVMAVVSGAVQIDTCTDEASIANTITADKAPASQGKRKRDTVTKTPATAKTIEDNSVSGAGNGRRRKRTKTAEPVEDIGVDITIDLKVFSTDELKKKKPSAKSSYVIINSNEPWSTLKAQLLAKIESTISTAKTTFKDYDIIFSVARKGKDLPLSNEEDFKQLIVRATAGDKKASATAKQIGNLGKDGANGEDKENHTESEGVATAKKKKGPKDPSELPGNKAHVAALDMLRSMYVCNDTQCRIGSTYCYVRPDNREHWALGNQKLDIWAAALIKGGTTKFTPPNHAKFAGIANPDVNPPSLIQQRKAALAQTKTHVPNAPVVIYANQPPANNAPHTPTAPIAALINRDLATFFGPPLSLSQFCSQYGLDSRILIQLQEGGFSTVGALRRVTVSEMQEMGLKRGEVAEVQEALENWATDTTTSSLIPHSSL